ncbi:MAG: perosamine synthetase [Bacteroidia bacterium]
MPLVEDAAESLGASYKGKQTGTFGLLGVFSFNGNKTVTAGGGGAIVTDDEGLAKLGKHLSTQAKVPHKWEYHHDHIGYNYRMPNLNAALACAQLENLSDFIQNKRELSEWYLKFFESYPEVILHREIEEAKSNYWLNAIQLASREKRDEFLSYMNEHGVMTRPIWTLMNKLDMFLDCPKSDLSNALYLEDRIVNLPSSVRI